MTHKNSISRRDALLGGLAAAFGGLTLTSISNAADAAADEDKAWTYTKLCPNKVAQRVYESFGTKGCMYGTLKGAVLEYAAAIEATDPAAAATARAFPFIGMQAGRGGCGGMQSICGGLNGAAIFMALFVTSNAELAPMIKELGKWTSETALPTFHPKDDPHKDDFPTAVGGDISCKALVTAWKDAASEEFKSNVPERCKRHVASIMAKAIELLNKHFEEA